MQIETFINAARTQGASDLHLEAGLPPALRVRGSLKTLAEPVPAKLLLEMAREVIGDEQWPRFVERRSFDLSRTIQGVRCRINILHTSRGIGFAILNIIGTLIAIPMGLLSFTVDQLEKVAEWGGKDESPETALTVAPAAAQAALVVRQESPAQAAPVVAAAAPTPKAAPAPTAEKAGGKAKFDKEAMLAKIREKKAQKGS